MRRRRHGMNSGQCRALAAVRRCKEVLPAFKVIPSGDGFLRVWSSVWLRGSMMSFPDMTQGMLGT